MKKSVGMEETSAKARQYSRIKTRLLIIQLLLIAAFLVIVIVSGASVFLRNLVAGWSGNFYLQVGLYLVAFSGIYYLLFVGLDFYSGFLLEHKFSLSNQPLFGWLKKSIKKGVLSLLLLLVAGEVLYFLLRYFPNYWWLLTTAVWMLFVIVLGKIVPVLIIPLFYKCTPLANERLKEKLIGLCKKCGVGIKQVFEIRLSKETKKANAAVAGMGKGRRILLSDTLLESFSEDEVEAVLAHELGHVQMLHIWKILAFGTVVALISFFLSYLFFARAMAALGFDEISDIAGFPLLAIVLMILGFAFMPIQNGYLRRLEKRADIFAAQHIASPNSFVSAMTKLAQQNLADPNPEKWEELLFYDHPSISKRLRYITFENNKG